MTAIAKQTREESPSSGKSFQPEYDPALFATLMQTIPDRIYFKDLKSRFITVSEAYLAYHKLRNLDEVTGKTDFDLFLPGHANKAFADEQEIIRTGKPKIGLIEKMELPDGRDGWALTTKVPLRDEKGSIIGTFGISRDVTELHNKEQQVIEYANALAKRQEELDEQLLLAREIQNALMPERFPLFGGATQLEESSLRFHHKYLPAGSVGGDFFNVQKLSETKAGILICDVMGHGVHAALITAIQRVLVDDLQPLAHDPALFLQNLNQRLCRTLKRIANPIFVTGCYLTVDISNGSITMANAAHPRPLHIEKDRHKVRLLGSSQDENKLPLGMMEDSKYTNIETTFSPGDTLLLYTDGLSDICNPDGLEFETKDLIRIVRRTTAPTEALFLDEIIHQVLEQSECKTFEDDVCLLSIEWTTECLKQQGVRV